MGTFTHDSLINFHMVTKQNKKAWHKIHQGRGDGVGGGGSLFGKSLVNLLGH